MGKSIILFLSAFIFFSTQAQFRNVKIADHKEGVLLVPGIAINQKNPDNIIAAIAPDQVVYTIDGGVTWNNTQVASPFGVQGSPALISDSKGHIYYLHQAKSNEQGFTDKLIIQKTTDKGVSWSEGAIIATNPTKDLRRQWPVLHPKKQSLYTVWTQFDKFMSADTSFHSNVFFSKSGGGEKWSVPVQISNRQGNAMNDDNTATGAMAAVDLEGRVFTTWANEDKIYMDRSYDGGDVWLRNDVVLSKQAGGWSMDIPGIGKTSGLPVMVMDNSGSPYHGSIYIAWADQSNGANDTDIWMIHSNNRGDNWSTPLRVNSDEKGKHQFMPWITVDQMTGYVYIVYYDRREDNADNFSTDVYIAYSVDGGNHFKDVKISESSFDPSGKEPFTEYINISAHKNVIAPVWVRMDGDRASVWTTVIKEKDLMKGK